MTQVLKIWSESRLRSSIKRIGLLTPVYKFRGQIIDGRKRYPIAIEVGQRPTVIELPSEIEMIQTLWELHPERALEWLGPDSLTSYAEKLGVPLSEVAQVLHSMRPRKTRDTRRERERWKGTRPALLQAWTAPSMRALAHLCASRDAKSLSDVAREALLQRIRETLGPAEIVKVWREYRVHDDGPLGDEMAHWIARLKQSG